MEKLLQWMVARRCRAAQVVAGVAPVKVAAGAVQEISPAEVAAGAPSVEVAADAYPAKIKTQRQTAGQMTSSVWHLLTQWYRRCQSDARTKNADCCGENCTRLVRKLRAWTRRLRTWTWQGSPHRRWQDWTRDTQCWRVSNDYFFFKVVKEDIKCKSN